MRWAIALGALGALGCYHPGGERDCTVSCADGVCPSGMACSQNGTALCHAAGAADCAPRDGRGSDGRVGDGGSPDALVPSDGGSCSGGLTQYGRAWESLCMSASQAQLLVASGQTTTLVDGDCMPLSQGGRTICVLGYMTIDVVGTLVVQTSNPAVLVGQQSIVIRSSGSVHAESSLKGLVGPGALAPGVSCSEGPASTGAGGAGGSFVGAGGTGGGNADNTTATLPAATISPMSLSDFHAGCPGGEPGGASGATERGLGGGALYVITNGTFVMESPAILDASGAGALGGPVSSGLGGGGGGAGGIVVLDALLGYAIGSSAELFALGGGGGGGAGGTTMGGPGADPTSTSGTTSGGTAGSANGGRGGDGNYLTAMGNGAVGGALGGGGGGGGGYGYIGVVATTGGFPTVGLFAPAFHQIVVP